MRRLDIPQKLIKLTEMTMRKTKSVIKVNKCISEEFGMMRGLRQGDCLAPLLFNVVLQMIVEEAGLVFQTEKIYNKTKQFLGYADNVVLISTTELH
jgi:hypothetical protein